MNYTLMMIVAVVLAGCGKNSDETPKTSGKSSNKMSKPVGKKSPPVVEMEKSEFDETKAKAEKGDMAAQYNLGKMYGDGKGVAKDEKQAVAWYVKSASQGHVGSQAALGLHYYYGNGVIKDNKKAVHWLLKASMQGHSFSQGLLGVMCDLGEGVPQNSTSAFVWCYISSLNGHAGATKYKNNVLSKKLNPSQITKAEELARDMIKKNPKLHK